MTKKLDIEFPRDFYLDDVGVWRLKKEKITELEASNVQTNEEWLRSATTEELAGKIYAWHTKGYARGKNGLTLNSVMEVVEWLKQPHKEE